MEVELLYWHWLVIGMVLIVAELFIPSFTIFWFGLAAFVVSAFLWYNPALQVSWQLFIWAVTSSVFTAIWFVLVRPLLSGRRPSRMVRENVLGESGHVIRVPVENKPGIVRFTTPLLGADEWPFVCDEAVTTGQRVFVKDINGEMLIVETRSH